jgi:hypothetical protein
MKCFFHNGRDATATCPMCGRALCVSCTARFSRILCEPCLLRSNEDLARGHRKRLLVTVVLGVAGVVLFSGPMRRMPAGVAPQTVAILLASLVLPMAYWGWLALTRHLPRVLLIMPIPFWLVFGVVRVLLSVVVGLFAAPWGIRSSIQELAKIRTTARAVRMGLI